MLPAGTYYIGDLCYVMHGEWDEFCGITITKDTCLDGEFKLADGRVFATYGTKWGDGEYPASNGASLCVDAGLIGCIRVEDISEEDLPNVSLGTVVEFDAPFHTGAHDGVIEFGHITVDTDPAYDEDDYDYDEEEMY